MKTEKEMHKNADETVFEMIPSAPEKNKSRIKKIISRDFIMGFLAAGVISAVILAVVLGPLVKNWSVANPITIEQAKAKAESYINENYMKAGTKVTIKNVTDKNGLYQITLNTGTAKDVDTYVTKDGKFFFPQADDMDKAQATPTPNVQVKKSDKPEVELFVMSHCPYGTQIEKGILPAVSALGNKINFDIKFTDYAMHGKKELDEEMTQHCIKTEQSAKFTNYLNCFLEDGDSARCVAKAAIEKAKLNTCVSATDKKFKVTENFNDTTKKNWKGTFPPFDIYKDSNAKYGVQGSPTLVINGTTINSGRDSASLLKTICSAFNTAPKECEASLSATAPAAGFGTGAGGGASSASCGS